MKILYLTHGTINFEERKNFYDTLVDMGHDVCYFNYIEKYLCFGDSDNVAKFENPNTELIKLASKWNPDLIFSILNTDQIDYKTFGKIRDMGFKILNWFCDDHWRFEDYTKHWLPYLDYAVTTDPNAVDKYKLEGFRNVIFSTWAVNPKHYIKQNLVKIYDVSFGGGAHGRRREVVEQIKRAGIDINAFGKGFTDRISFGEMINIFNQSKINLNFATCSDPKYKQMKARNFEIPCCEAFTITEYIPELENYFNEKEMAWFHDTNDLIDKIKYWLQHSAEREFTAKLARERVLKEHIYMSRFNNIFKKIGLK